MPEAMTPCAPSSLGDHLLFHYSGHGSQKRDLSGEEADGKAMHSAQPSLQSRGTKLF